LIYPHATRDRDRAIAEALDALIEASPRKIDNSSGTDAVEPRSRHKNQKIMATGPELELPLACERQAPDSAHRWRSLFLGFERRTRVAGP